MDPTTLDGLRTAYKVAPSTELARIIALALTEQQCLEELLELLPALSNTTLPDDEAQRLGDFLLQQAQPEAAARLLDAQQPGQVLLKVRALLASQQQTAAKTLYQQHVEADDRRRNLELEQQLGIVPSDARPRLRVIEKPDMATVTDLGRYRQQGIDFSQVVGLDDIKRQIEKKIILPFQKPSLFQRFRKKIGGGVLLYGPPGCGKTLLARATAGECKADFYNIEISDVLDMYIGESEQKLHAIFEKARARTPSVLFFDELEALAGKREHSRNGNSSQIVSQFLTELDGFAQNNTGVLVLASTNVPWSIDPAFLRPGRFDRLFFVAPPDAVAREAILRHHANGRPMEDAIDFAWLARQTSGYSGADLENLLDMAADEAIDASLAAGHEVPIGQPHVVQALQQSRSSTHEWLTTARNYARYANDGGRYDDVLAFLNKHGK